MEGGHLRASSQRAWLRPLSLLAVATTLVSSLVLTSPRPADAVNSHAPEHAPRLIGMSRARVYSLMHADGLYFQTRGPGSATGKWVSVVAQSPSPGTLVAWHSQLTLTTTLQSPTGPRRVPRLVGLSRAQVYAALKRAALYFRTTGPGSSNATWIVALHQSPPAGTRVRWHSEVVVAVSTHRPVVKVAPHPAVVKPKPRPRPKPVVRQTIATSSNTDTSTTMPVTTSTYPGEVTTTTTTVTTTTVPVTTTTVKKVVARSRIGVATWYNYVPGRCATWFLPMGTRLTIESLATGKTIHCTVTDHEAARGDRVVDLSETQFSQLAPLARGVVSVKVSW